MSLSNFPLAHQNFILSFSGTVKYVDIVNGLDSNNGDTGATAYRTLEHAQSTTSAISTAVMYVINPGTYDLQAAAVSGPQGTSSAAFLDGNLPYPYERRREGGRSCDLRMVILCLLSFNKKKKKTWGQYYK